MNLKKLRSKKGFTLIEVIVVVTIIAILAVLTVVAYRGLTANALDKNLQSDVDHFTTAETNYEIHNNGTPLAYYSGNGYSSALGVGVSPGDIIDIVANSTDFCIRAYNPNANKNSPTNAFTYESTPGACTSLAPSSQADYNYPPTSWVAVSVGQQFECGIASNLKAYCWGNNPYGQLGNGTTTSSSTPVPVNMSGVLKGLTITMLATGSNRTCAVASDNNIYCWGENSFGEFGNGTTSNSSVPVATTMTGALAGKTIVAMGTGTESTCVIASDGNVYCWGDNSAGQIGNGTTTSSLVPTETNMTGVLAGKTAKQLKVGNQSVCILASDSEVYCWGINSHGQAGNGTTTVQHNPVAVSTSGVLAGKTVLQLAAGDNSHVCVIASDNQPYCWGYDGSGQLGNNTTGDQSTPVAVITSGALSGKYAQTISTGSGNSCVVASDNEAYCWGTNSAGELGNGSGVTTSGVPVAVSTTGALNGKSLITTQVGNTDICVIASDAQNYCWGDNSYGQLGNGTSANSNIPVQVSLPTS